MRVNLNVRYEDRHDAKLLGAWWDSARKCWYVVDPKDLTPFMRWIQPKVEPVVRVIKKRKKPKKAKKSKNTMLPNWRNEHAPPDLLAMWREKLPAMDKQPPDLMAIWREKLPYNPKPITTGPSIGPADCGCTTPPWEPCEHTAAWLARTVAEQQGLDIRG